MPWRRDMDEVYASARGAPRFPLAAWPEADTEMEDRVLACATLMFVGAGAERASTARDAPHLRRSPV